MYTSNWQPAVAAQNSPVSPTITEFRKRSLPSHIIEAQKKEALAMVTEEESVSDELAQSNLTQHSFFKRHFYRPTQKKDGEISESTSDHHFSFLSRGFLTLAATLCLVVVAVLCAVLATIYVRHQKQDRATRLSPVREAIVANFPDPAIIHHEGTWFALATTNAAGILSQPHNASSYEYGRSNVQIATSSDFSTWTLLDSTHDPLPELGGWVKRGFTKTEPPIPLANVWAPAVTKRPSDDKFVLYYSAAAENATRSHCIGAAISDSSSPAGPYTPLNTTITCPIHDGGAIDPTPFIDIDGTMYLAWKVDGNNVGHGGVCGNSVPPLLPTPIKLQKMNADGVTPEGLAVTILDRTEEDGPLVEAPVIVRSREGIYFLFFSSGCTRDPSYDVKYAWANEIAGPYHRANKTLLKTDDYRLLAPGSVGIAEKDDGSFAMAFHARVSMSSGKVRAMFTSTIKFNGTEAFVVRTESR